MLKAPVNAALLAVATSASNRQQTGTIGMMSEGDRSEPSGRPAHNHLGLAPSERVNSSEHNVDFSVDWLDPRDLLIPDRFDFGAKILYARLRERGVACDWGRLVYSFHLAVWNQFSERFPCKASEADFLDSFHRLLDATRLAAGRGLHSLIPLARNGAPVDGAHRIISALQMGKSVACVMTDLPPATCDYNYTYFQDRLNEAGHVPGLESLASDVFDAMALEFCRVLPKIAIAVKFPAARGRNGEVDQILSEHASIFYKKAVQFRNDGPVELMRTIYEKEEGLGTLTTNFDGARQQAKLCFARRGPAYFYLLAFKDYADLEKAKERVRDLFGISTHTMHITDTRDEALRVAKLALSDNSIRFANLRSHREMANFSRLFSIYRTAFSGAEDADDYCIDGSAVMSAYGIRDCGGLDFLSRGGQLIPPVNNQLFALHNEHAQYYGPKTLDDIIYDHRNHFWLSGIKFATLANVWNWKHARGQARDHEDIRLMDAWGFRNPL
jgi:hypothetical protein